MTEKQRLALEKKEKKLAEERLRLEGMKEYEKKI